MRARRSGVALALATGCLAWSLTAWGAPATAADPEAGLQDEADATAAASSGPRRLAIGEIDAPAQSDARGAVLEALSTRSEVEIVGYEDVKMAGKNLGVDPATPRGRKRITEELGVFAWVEGKVSATHEARLQLVDGTGRALATMQVRADDGPALDAAIRDNLWSALGRFVSEVAARKYALEQQRTLALDKQQARQDELLRQQELAIEREARRKQRLNDHRSLAREKQVARFEELQRQVELVVARREQEARGQQLAAEQAARQERERVAALERQQAEAQRLAEAERRQEQARLAAAARQQRLQAQPAQPPAWQPPQPSQPAQPPAWQPAQRPAWQPAQPRRTWPAAAAQPASAPPPSRFPRYDGPTYEAPSRFGASSSATRAATPSYDPSQEDYGAPVSPETQRWLEARGLNR